MGNCNCNCLGAGPETRPNDSSNQRFKLLIIGPSFAGKTTFLKSLQIIYGDGFDDVSYDTYKDIITKQIILCIRTILEHFVSPEEEKMMDDDISYQSEMIRDHSHLSVDDISRNTYSGTSRNVTSRSSSHRASNLEVDGTVLAKKFSTPEIAQAAEFFLQTHFSDIASYREWLNDKQFIEHLNLLWNDKTIQKIFENNYFLTMKLPYSSKYFLETVIPKMSEILNDISNNINPNNDEKYDNEQSSLHQSHKNQHSRTASFVRRMSDRNNNNSNKDNNINNNDDRSPRLSTNNSRSRHSTTDGIGSSDDDQGSNLISNRSGSSYYNPTNKDILLCYHRTINRNKEYLNLPNKLTYEVWDVGGSKSEIKKWILYSQKTNIVIFMIPLYQTSMLKYTFQLWDSVINTKYEHWFGTQRNMNDLILMASDSSSRANSTAIRNSMGNGIGGDRSSHRGRQSTGSRHTNSGYGHMYGPSHTTTLTGSNNNSTQIAQLTSNSSDMKDNTTITTSGQNQSNTIGSNSTTITNGQPIPSNTQMVDIKSIPCILMFNGRERLVEMIEKEKLNVKSKSSGCSSFFINFNGDTTNGDEVIEYIRDQFMKVKKKENRVTIHPRTIDCIDIENVKRAFEEIQEIASTQTRKYEK